LQNSQNQNVQIQGSHVQHTMPTQDDRISIDINDINDDKEDSERTSNESTNLILHKTDLILLNNGWNNKNEQLIISIGENAASYKWMHEKCSIYYKSQQSAINVLLIIFAVVLTTLTVTPQIDNNNILSIVFTNIITILTILQNFLKSEQTSERHINASIQFNDLYHDIQKQMCMYRRDRLNATIYVSENLKRYDSLVINNPEILKFIINKFKKTFKNSNIALPDIADRIQKIEIITENPQSQSKNTRTINKINTTLTDSTTFDTNNLSQIHNAFQIHGDISDRDLQNLNPSDLKELRNKFIQKKSNYEYQRFLEHSKETD